MTSWKTIPADLWDVAVVGGGPAGMTAAMAAARAGAAVVLLERGERPGKKLLMTGWERRYCPPATGNAIWATGT